MPCNSIITQAVELDKCTDAAMLKDAMACVNLMGCYISGGKLVGDSRIVGKVADQIKQAYSRRAIYAAAKKNNWQVIDKGGNKLQLRRF